MGLGRNVGQFLGSRGGILGTGGSPPGDHGLLSGLGDDDHSQYALLAGRSGGQTLHGGTGAGDNLLLRSTSHSTKGTVDSARKTRTHVESASYTDDVAIIEFPQTATIDLTNVLALRGIFFATTLLFQTNGQTLNLFNASYLVNTNATTRTITALNTIQFNPVISPLDTGAGTFTCTNFRGINIVPTLTALASATGVITTLVGVRMAPITVNAGWTITTHCGLLMQNDTGAGAVGTAVGLDVEDLTKGGTANLSVRSAGAAVEMRHNGPAVFGANAAPNAVAALEARSTTKGFLVPRMTTAQKNAIAAVKGLIVYDTTLDTFEGFQGAGAGAWAAM